MSHINQAVILAGGLGTRLLPFTKDNPKPMIEINKRPFIEYLIKQVREFGISDILILLGYLPNKIIEFLGDGSQYGVKIEYDITPVDCNTGGRLLNAYGKLQNEFLLMYCDNYCPVDFRSLCKSFFQNKSEIQISVYANLDFYSKSNFKIGDDGMVFTYDKQRMEKDLQGIDIGYAIIDKKVLRHLENSDANFEGKVYPKVIADKKMFATVTQHRYYSIGSWEKIDLTNKFFSNPKTVFLDRDGTINEKAPQACYIEKPEEFIWLKGAREAIKRLNDADIQIIMVTNQPGIARGCLTEGDLASIHQKMESDLNAIGAHIDKIYYCPHNWDEGCDCRKPKPGMFYKAQKEYSLNLVGTTMFGDDERDKEAALAAGVGYINISNNYTLEDAVNDFLNHNN